MRFKEKGGKVKTLPIPDEFAALLQAAVASDDLDTSPGAYVVPMQRKQAHSRERDDRVIWRIVKNLGKRAGVEVHPTLCARRSRCSSSRPIRASWRRCSD